MAGGRVSRAYGGRLLTRTVSEQHPPDHARQNTPQSNTVQSDSALMRLRRWSSARANGRWWVHSASAWSLPAIP